MDVTVDGKDFVIDSFDEDNDKYTVLSDTTELVEEKFRFYISKCALKTVFLLQSSINLSKFEIIFNNLQHF